MTMPARSCSNPFLSWCSSRLGSLYSMPRGARSRAVLAKFWRKETAPSATWAERIRQRFPSICLALLFLILIHSCLRKDAPISADEKLAARLAWGPWKNPSFACDLTEGPGFFLVSEGDTALEVFLREDGQVLIAPEISLHDVPRFKDPQCQKIPRPSQIEEVVL